MYAVRPRSTALLRNSVTAAWGVVYKAEDTELGVREHDDRERVFFLSVTSLNSTGKVSQSI